LGVEGLVASFGQMLTTLDPGALADLLSERGRQFWSGFTGAYSRISALHLLAAVPFAAIAWKLHESPGPHFNLTAFIRFLFPRAVYCHPSARLDLKIFVVSFVVRPTRFLLFGLSLTAVTIALAGLLRDWFGTPDPVFSGGPVSIALLGILLLLLTDFSTYVTHRLSHEVKPLWAFHRVHHSAPVMTPLTLMRKHPVYDALGALIDIALLAPMKAAVIYFWPEDVGAGMAGITALGFAGFGLLAGNLRHSHIWLSFGPMLERVLISPAMHQIHHSKARRHWDRNYGEVFAVWDWMFGTLYVPRGRESLEFGVVDHPDPHPTWRRAMVEPFGYALRALSHELGTGGRSLTP